MKPGDIVFLIPWGQYVKIVSIGKPLPRGNINVAYKPWTYGGNGHVKTSAENGIYFENKHLRPLKVGEEAEAAWDF